MFPCIQLALTLAGVTSVLPKVEPRILESQNHFNPDQEWGLGITLRANGLYRGCTVDSLFSNSPAGSIGFCLGDIILAVNGKVATDPRITRKLIFSGRPTTTILIHRGNQLLEYEITYEDKVVQSGGNGTKATAESVRTIKSVKKTVIPMSEELLRKSNPIRVSGPAMEKPNRPIVRTGDR